MCCAFAEIMAQKGRERDTEVCITTMKILEGIYAPSQTTWRCLSSVQVPPSLLLYAHPLHIHREVLLSIYNALHSCQHPLPPQHVSAVEVHPSRIHLRGQKPGQNLSLAV